MDLGIQIFETKLKQINPIFYNLINPFIKYISFTDRQISTDGNNKLYKDKKFYYSTMLDLKFYNRDIIANDFTFRALFHDIGHAIFFMIEEPDRLNADNFGLSEFHSKNIYEEVNAILISEKIFEICKELDCYQPTERLRLFLNNKVDINEKYLKIDIYSELEKLNYVLTK